MTLFSTYYVSIEYLINKCPALNDGFYLPQKMWEQKEQKEQKSILLKTLPYLSHFCSLAQKFSKSKQKEQNST